MTTKRIDATHVALLVDGLVVFVGTPAQIDRLLKWGKL